MKNVLPLIVLITLGFSSCGQDGQSSTTKKATEQAALPDKPTLSEKDIHTDFNYLDSAGQGVIIQNSYPRGGVPVNGKKGYTALDGRRFGNGIFWTRMVNKTEKPIRIEIDFPADSFAISSLPNTYFKLLLPPDTMTRDKIPLFNYGFEMKDLASFLDNNFYEKTTFQRTIQPNQECLFYVVLLIHLPDNGPIRSGFYLENEQLFYKIDISPYGATTFSSGKIRL